MKERSLFEILKLSINLLKTKIFFPKARLIRFPFDIRGSKYIRYGKNFTAGTGCRIEAYKFFKDNPVLRIGDNVQINDYVHLACANSLTIEDNVLIASKVYISDINHGNYSGENQSSPYERAAERIISSKPVKIMKNVWIGENCAVLPGTVIGANSIIGANSVVSRNIPENCIAVGNPARIIKKYNDSTRKWEKVQ